MSAGGAAAREPREFELVRGSQSAVVREGGAALRSYRVGGRELLDGFGRRGWSRDGRGQVLLPWPNRVRHGRYRFGGAAHQLPLSEPERGNAIHGLARWAPWTPLDRSSEAITLGLELQPQTGYPYWLELRCRHLLTTSGLQVTLGAVNLGDSAAPFGAGSHPYLRLDGEAVDDLQLQLPAASFLEADGAGLPTGRKVPVAGTPYDFRTGRRIGSLALDTAFCDLGAAPRWEATLAAPPGSERLRLWAEAAFRFAMVYTADSVREPDRRRRGLALEPMTCAPDAFNNGLGLLRLEPGGHFEASWGLEPGA